MQSAKKALTRILHGRSITDEILNSALVEVESILNGRPLTQWSSDNALTIRAVLETEANDDSDEDQETNDDESGNEEESDI